MIAALHQPCPHQGRGHACMPKKSVRIIQRISPDPVFSIFVNAAGKARNLFLTIIYA
jgi:hypothetical protein